MKMLNKIKEYQNIVLFRHVFADMDAIGSQLGLKELIQYHFPNKKVYAVGTMSDAAKNFVDHMDEVDESILSQSLAIVLDTANGDRVDDQRYKLAKESIRIDHHVFQEKFCDLEYVDDKASATCEIIPLFCKEKGISLNKKSAQLFYSGLIADSIRFTISSVRPETFMAASYLVEQGADVLKSEEINFSKSYQDYQYETVVRKNSVRKEDFLYSINEHEDFRACGLSFSQAKEKVYALADIREIKIWALFTRMEDGVHYSASLRARTLEVRKIAQQFNGGGHKCAAGIKNLTIEEVHQIIELCAKKSLE